MKKPSQHLTAEVPRSSSKRRDDDRDRPWGCLDGEVFDRGAVSLQSFGGVGSGLPNLSRVRIVIVANMSELRAISHSNRKSQQAAMGAKGTIRSVERLKELPRALLIAEILCQSY